jgi:hypothetical protein
LESRERLARAVLMNFGAIAVVATFGFDASAGDIGLRPLVCRRLPTDRQQNFITKSSTSHFRIIFHIFFYYRPAGESPAQRPQRLLILIMPQQKGVNSLAEAEPQLNAEEDNIVDEIIKIDIKCPQGIALTAISRYVLIKPMRKS